MLKIQCKYDFNQFKLKSKKTNIVSAQSTATIKVLQANGKIKTHN